VIEGGEWRSDETVYLMDIGALLPSSTSWVKISSECALYHHDGKGREREEAEKEGERRTDMRRIRPDFQADF